MSSLAQGRWFVQPLFLSDCTPAVGGTEGSGLLPRSDADGERLAADGPSDLICLFSDQVSRHSDHAGSSIVAAYEVGRLDESSLVKFDGARSWPLLPLMYGIEEDLIFELRSLRFQRLERRRGFDPNKIHLYIRLVQMPQLN